MDIAMIASRSLSREISVAAGEVREQGTKFCVGTPDDCIRFLELYEALGIGGRHLIVRRRSGAARGSAEEVIPHFQAKRARADLVRASAQ